MTCQYCKGEDGNHADTCHVATTRTIRLDEVAEVVANSTQEELDEGVVVRPGIPGVSYKLEPAAEPPFEPTQAVDQGPMVEAVHAEWRRFLAKQPEWTSAPRQPGEIRLIPTSTRDVTSEFIVDPPGALIEGDLYRVHKKRLSRTLAKVEFARMGGQARAKKLPPAERQRIAGAGGRAARKARQVRLEE